MKKLLTIAILMVAAFFTANAQTGEELFEKSMKAMGYDKLEAIKTFSLKGIMSSPMIGDLPMIYKKKSPNKFYFEIEAMGNKIVTFSNGTKTWSINPMAGSTEAQEVPEQFKDQVDQVGKLLNPLKDYKKDAEKIEVLPEKAKVNEKDCFVVVITNKEKNQEKYFIDAITYFLVKVAVSGQQQGQPTNIEITFNDLGKAKGFVYAKQMEISDGTQKLQEFRIEEFKIDEAIDDSIFEVKK